MQAAQRTAEGPSVVSRFRRLAPLFPRVPLSVPWWNGATYQAAFRSIVSGAIIDGPDLRALRFALCSRLHVADVFLCGSGSLALEIALRGCGVRQNDEVVIPAFCCSAVVPPIVALGARPVLADVGAELNLAPETFERALTSKTRAVIVPHLFGNPADIGAIVDLARDRKIRVIDDAAQALGATIDDRLVGSFGDAGILSFGAEKVCFGLGGGAVVAAQTPFSDNHAGMALAPPQRAATLRVFFATLVFRRWRRWTFALQEFLSREDVNPEAPPAAYRKERLANLNAAVALALIETLYENIAARRVRARAYRELLADVDGLELIAHRPGSACLAQVVRVRKRRRGEDLAFSVMEALNTAGYQVRGSYVPLHRLSHCSMCVWDDLPHTDRIWPDLIELPCDPDVSLQQVEQIVSILKRTIGG